VRGLRGVTCFTLPLRKYDFWTAILGEGLFFGIFGILKVFIVHDLGRRFLVLEALDDTG
jgi:hypothetical protein